MPEVCCGYLEVKGTLGVHANLEARDHQAPPTMAISTKPAGQLRAAFGRGGGVGWGAEGLRGL